ncbi:MAG: lytic transglycosylase domain-containing protein [Bdellovibrionota bacterium]|nr:lytic transglycosylase domain-containing protein [Bdellovibrionota bacterium]
MKAKKSKKSNIFSKLEDLLLVSRLFVYILVVTGLYFHKAHLINGALPHLPTIAGKEIQFAAARAINPDLELALLKNKLKLESSKSRNEYYEFDKEIAMDDFFNKIHKDFKVSKSMKNRVSFWFDVYAKYDENQHIIHHAKYPWIVFDVVDISSIKNNMKLHRWTRYHRAKDLVKNRRKEIRNIYKRLSRLKRFDRLNSKELRLLKLLRGTPGKFRDRLKLASRNVRSQTGQRNFFEEGLDRYSQWIHEIENTFKKHRLPLELTRIPFVESSYNPEATSKVGASGVWQLMPSIGKKFLRVNDKIDERNDPILSAKAAAKLFKENKMILRKWPLAVTAYNTGPGLVKRAMKKTRTDKIHHHIDRFHAGAFGFAAKNFYASFLAALHVEKYQDRFFKIRKLEKQISQLEAASSQLQRYNQERL